MDPKRRKVALGEEYDYVFGDLSEDELPDLVDDDLPSMSTKPRRAQIDPRREAAKHGSPDCSDGDEAAGMSDMTTVVWVMKSATPVMARVLKGKKAVANGRLDKLVNEAMEKSAKMPGVGVATPDTTMDERCAFAHFIQEHLKVLSEPSWVQCKAKILVILSDLAAENVKNQPVDTFNDYLPPPYLDMEMGGD